MKKIANLLTVILLTLYSFLHAQETKLSFEITLNGNYQPDSIYLLFHPTVEIEPGQRFPNPQKILITSEKTGVVYIEPGFYTITVLAQGYLHLTRPVIIPNNEEENSIEINLNPAIIGYWNITSVDQINKVTIRGDFNNFAPENEIPLVKENNVWILKQVPNVLKKDMRYLFYVNEQGTIDLLNKHVKPDLNWLGLKNIYQGNSKLIFDPSLYSIDLKPSQLHVTWIEMQNEFVKMVDNWNLLLNELNNIYKNKFDSPITQQKAKIDSLFAELNLMTTKYDPNINQFLIEKNLSLNILKYMSLNPPKRNQVQNNEEFENQQKEFLLSEPFKTYFKENLELMQKLNPNSFLLKGDFLQIIFSMQQTVKKCPELIDEFSLSENYFEDFVDNFIKQSSNERLCYKILYTQALVSIGDDEEKAEHILIKLKNEYPHSKFELENKVDMLLARLNIKMGKPAPDFSTDLLNGNTFNLKDYKGKFVFIDFWGSWCAPCRNEIPNLIKLYDSTSRDRLEIIGLAQDKEPNLRKYIADNNIEYPNSLAPKDLLAKYGIRKYPTSFLINPDGKITRIDVRGADAMDLLKDEINNYFR